ncbi:unnamed protein product [Ranitomeya imitator]|uniref:PLA2c domain-containing protein n=1 Tax=Ranitomeya imitator TaxID=111125 RepID=A0ABN9MH40_9NEOB|nr:unnamed protein product [Ranitomeya imitator]
MNVLIWGPKLTNIGDAEVTASARRVRREMPTRHRVLAGDADVARSRPTRLRSVAAGSGESELTPAQSGQGARATDQTEMARACAVWIVYKETARRAQAPLYSEIMTQGPDAPIRSDGEAASLKARQKKVWEALQKLNVNVQKSLMRLMKKTLSNHRTCCESGENPYPVYSAVEGGSLNTKHAGAWFEFTPHQVGFPAYKTFVNTELLGSQFREGNLVKHHPERDLCYLQEKFEKLFPNIRNEENLCSCEGCQKVGVILSSHDLVMLTDEERKLLAGDNENIGFCEKVILILKVLKSFIHWQWGTTNNFLYEFGGPAKRTNGMRCRARAHDPRSPTGDLALGMLSVRKQGLSPREVRSPLTSTDFNGRS